VKYQIQRITLMFSTMFLFPMLLKIKMKLYAHWRWRFNLKIFAFGMMNSSLKLEIAFAKKSIGVWQTAKLD